MTYAYENDKRKFARFNIPIIIEFKPTKATTEYSWGLTRNFSCEGFSFETLRSDLKPKDTLELKLKFPQRGTFVSVLGDIVWQKQITDKYMAGIKLRDVDKEAKKEFLEEISAHGNVPVDKFLNCNDPDTLIRKKRDVKSEAKLGTGQKKAQRLPIKTECMGIEKHYLESSSACKVTFRLPKDAVSDAQKVTIVGDFNGWDNEATEMDRLENGDFAITLELKSGMEYRFRYLINGDRWENDWCADRYASNPFGCDDSVVVI